jgi:hypothetical protein
MNLKSKNIIPKIKQLIITIETIADALLIALIIFILVLSISQLSPK